MVGGYIGGQPRGGDRPPCRPLGGRQAPLFSRDLVAHLKKKIYTKGMSPYGRPGGIFEIFQNGHIFLKFLFFLNIKKKKRLRAVAFSGPAIFPRPI